jgi:hypothetical protein
MSYEGLRDWLVQVDAMGELRTLEGIDWNLEMGAVVDVLYREHPPYPPALVFDKIKEHATGFRTLFGHFASPKRIALTLGISREFSHVLEFVRAYHEKMKRCSDARSANRSGSTKHPGGESGQPLRFSRATAPRKRWRPLHRHGSFGHH